MDILYIYIYIVKRSDKADFVFCLFDVDETPRTVGLSEKQGMITGAYNVFSTHGVNPRYFYYYYLALDNAVVATMSSQNNAPLACH